MWFRSPYITLRGQIIRDTAQFAGEKILKDLLWIALAGAIGSLARYGVAGVVQRFSGERFPWGTFAVNAAGCFLFGLVWMLAEDRMMISGRTRMVALTGFMGAFTTFSTFAFETSKMLNDSQWSTAALNIAAHNVVGIGCVLIGLAIGKLL